MNRIKKIIHKVISTGVLITFLSVPAIAKAQSTNFNLQPSSFNNQFISTSDIEVKNYEEKEQVVENAIKKISYILKLFQIENTEINLDTLTIRFGEYSDYSQTNKGISTKNTLGLYISSTNTIWIFIDNLSDELDWETVLEHELLHVLSNSGFSLFAFNEGFTSALALEIFDNSNHKIGHQYYQCIMDALKEVVNPYDIMKFYFTNDDDSFYDQIYPDNEKGQIINLFSNYAYYCKKMSQKKEIDYDEYAKKIYSLRLEILKELYKIEKNKIISNINTGYYGTGEEATINFVRHVNYILDLNHMTVSLDENSLNQLDEMRFEFENEVYYEFSNKYNISMKSIDIVHQNIQLIDKTINYYNINGYQYLPIEHRDMTQIYGTHHGPIIEEQDISIKDIPDFWDVGIKK